MTDQTRASVDILKTAKQAGGDWHYLLRVMGHILRKGRQEGLGSDAQKLP